MLVASGFLRLSCGFRNRTFLNHFRLAIFFSVLSKWKRGALFFAAIWNASSCNVCLESPNSIFSMCRICVTWSSSISLERIFGLPKCLVLSLACLLLYSKRLCNVPRGISNSYAASHTSLVNSHCIQRSSHYFGRPPPILHVLFCCFLRSANEWKSH